MYETLFLLGLMWDLREWGNTVRISNSSFSRESNSMKRYI